MKKFQKKLNNSDITCIPTHGNPSQLINTAKIAEEAGLKFYIVMNANELKLTNHGNDKTTKIAENTHNSWIGVTEISDNTSSIREYVYTLLDNNFESLGETINKVTMKVNLRKPHQKNNNKSEKKVNFSKTDHYR